jgi:hypothetical protein
LDTKGEKTPAEVVYLKNKLIYGPKCGETRCFLQNAVLKTAKDKARSIARAAAKEAPSLQPKPLWLKPHLMRSRCGRQADHRCYSALRAVLCRIHQSAFLPKAAAQNATFAWPKAGKIKKAGLGLDKWGQRGDRFCAAKDRLS